MISTFGEDERGELYLAHYNATAGAIYRIVGLAAQKDLRIEALTVLPTSAAPGANVTVNYQVANRGTASVSGAYAERVYLSNNATLGGDMLLGTSPTHTTALAANTTLAASLAVTIPAATAPGGYYILVQADALGAVAEGNETNNVTAIPITLTSTSSGASGKDLRIESARFWPTSVSATGGTTFIYNVANRGSATVTEVYAEKIYLSKDASLGGDTLLATSFRHTATLAPNATFANTHIVTLPAGTAPGSYFILLQADALGTVSESNEGNNVTAIPITLTP
jgi:subtilase family serine protease